MSKIFRNYTTLAEYKADNNKPINTVCFIKDSKVIYVNGIQYSYKQLDYLPPATTEAEAILYMKQIVKNAKNIGLIYFIPVLIIYWTGNSGFMSNTISISNNRYTSESDKVKINGIEYYQLKLDRNLNNDFYEFGNGIFTNLIFKDVNTSKVTNMSGMFYNCNRLTSLDVSGFDTSNVTDMGYMFLSCYDLKSLDVSKFNTSNVTDMRYMFGECHNITSLDLSGFDTSNVTDMYFIFTNCRCLKSLNLSVWDINNVTNMDGMFYGCQSLVSLDISGWNINNITNMNSMFNSCYTLKTIRMTGCSQDTINKIKTALSDAGITSCTIVTE